MTDGLHELYALLRTLKTVKLPEAEAIEEPVTRAEALNGVHAAINLFNELIEEAMRDDD